MSPVACQANTVSWVTENEIIAWNRPWGGPARPACGIDLFSGGLDLPCNSSVVGNCGFFFMAAACATRLPHPHPGRAVAVGLRLLIRQIKYCLFRC